MRIILKYDQYHIYFQKRRK